MSIFEWLGIGAGSRGENADVESEAVREIISRLGDLPLDRARWVASFAMVLARTARADFLVSVEEARAMEDILRELGGLDHGMASLVADMASHRDQLLGASEAYLATREFRKVAADGDPERLLHCLFAVSAADDSITLVEEEEIRQIANELGIEHAEFNRVRARFRDKRAVLRDLPDRG
jgi:uncharacterized tellurite resistance protein B-like protein